MPTATWYCDMCGAPWNTCEDAAACERGHTHVQMILNEEYDPNGVYFHEPIRIKVRTTDGKEVWYEKSIDQ